MKHRVCHWVAYHTTVACSVHVKAALQLKANTSTTLHAFESLRLVAWGSRRPCVRELEFCFKLPIVYRQQKSYNCEFYKPTSLWTPYQPPCNRFTKLCPVPWTPLIDPWTPQRCIYIFNLSRFSLRKGASGRWLLCACDLDGFSMMHTPYREEWLRNGIEHPRRPEASSVVHVQPFICVVSSC